MNEQKKYPVYSPYFAKRKAKMNPKLKEEIEKTAAADPEIQDTYGSYKPGTFTHRDCIVDVSHNGAWQIDIYSENPITLPIATEIRHRLAPADTMMALLMPGKAAQQFRSTVILVELSASTQEQTEEAEQ